MVNQLVGQVAKGHENAILFRDVNMCIKNPNHNCSLCIKTLANGCLVRQTFIDNESSLSIMPLSILKVIKIDERCIVKQAMDMLTFDNAFVYTLGFVNVDFKMEPIQCPARFN